MTAIGTTISIEDSNAPLSVSPIEPEVLASSEARNNVDQQPSYERLTNNNERHDQITILPLQHEVLASNKTEADVDDHRDSSAEETKGACRSLIVSSL